MERTVLAALLLLLAGSASPQVTTTTICPTRSFVQAPGTQYCYQYVASPEDWFTANKTCQSRGDASSLLWIASDSENTYVLNTFFTSQGNQKFWIGLNDVTTEGVFQWALRVGGQYYEQPSGWGSQPGNEPVKDCVEFTEDGWMVNPLYCTERLNYVCKQQVCNSTDGLQCDSTGSSYTGSSTSSSSVAGAVIGVLLFIVVLVVILVLVLLWKFQNDKFYHYLCCCIYTKTQPAIHSLQQENQRLRQELAQQKLSMSGRFPQGGLQEDTGGVMKNTIGSLPPLKPQLGTDPLSSSMNNGMSFPRPNGARIAPMSPIPMSSIPAPPFAPGSMLPPLKSSVPPAMQVGSPLPRMGLGLPPIAARSFPPLRSPLSPIAEKSPMSPTPSMLGQSLSGNIRPPLGVIHPPLGRMTPMGGALRGPATLLPPIGIKLPLTVGQPLGPIGQATTVQQPTSGQIPAGQIPSGQVPSTQAPSGQVPSDMGPPNKEQDHQASDSEAEEKADE